jgi:hypothetical protein
VSDLPPSAASVCGAIANLMRDTDISDAQYEGVRQAYGVALDAAGLGRPGIAEERQQLIDALTDCVVKATDYGTQDGDFVAMYLLPTGPIHRAIPLLQRLGVTARPGRPASTTA